MSVTDYHGVVKIGLVVLDDPPGHGRASAAHRQGRSPIWRLKMKAQTTGTLIDRVVQLDQPVNLPNHSRVNVSIESMNIDPAEARAALEAFRKRIRQRPIHSGGRRFTRA